MDCKLLAKAISISVVWKFIHFKSLFVLKEKANLHNERIFIEIKMVFEKKISKGIADIGSLTAENMGQLFSNAKQVAFNEVSRNSNSLREYIFSSQYIFS